MMKSFNQRLAVALVSYVLVIPAVYFFIKTLYGLGDLFALACVGIAVLLTLPVLTVRSVQRYREIRSVLESDSSSLAQVDRSGKGLLVRVGLALLGTIIAVWGTLSAMDGQAILGVIVALGGAAITATAAISIMRLGVWTADSERRE